MDSFYRNLLGRDKLAEQAQGNEEVMMVTRKHWGQIGQTKMGTCIRMWLGLKDREVRTGYLSRHCVLLS